MAKDETHYKSSVKFNIRKTGHVYLSFSYYGNRVLIYTKENLQIEFWNSKLQRAKYSTKNPTADLTNQNLNKMQSTITKLFKEYTTKYNRLPTPKEIKELFQMEFFEELPQFNEDEHKTLLEVFDEYIETKRIENTESTARKYQQAKQNLIDFGKKYKKTIQIEKITMNFRNKFIEYLRVDLGYAPSTIYRHLKFIKTVILYGLDSKYFTQTNININLSKFLTKDKPGNHIALSEIELHELENLDLSKNQRLDRVRDRFLIGCYTGLRFSDFIRLSKNHIQDGEYIIIEQKKTNRTVTIPFMDNTKAIFEKYDYELPKPISEAKFNQYLKEVTAQCETLQRLQETTQYIGGKEKKVNVPRYQMTTSHTARRTFVTLNHARGIDLEDLTIATGHSSVKALKTYVKLNNIQKAEILRKKFLQSQRKENDQAENGKIININAS